MVSKPIVSLPLLIIVSFLFTSSANALASACEYILQRQTSRYMPVSRIFIYFNGRVIQQGICREAIWPYKEYLLNQKPSELVYTEAKQYIVNVSALPLNVNLIKKSLVDGIHVAAVIKMKNGSHQSATSMNGYISMPSSDGTIFNRVYAYAVLIVGYDDDTKYFIVRNSWGKEWVCVTHKFAFDH